MTRTPHLPTTEPPATPNDERCLPVALAFAAGHVDTLGFVALFGLFVARVTGNFVLIGSEVTYPTHVVLLEFVAFPAFVAVPAATTILDLKLRAAGRLFWPVAVFAGGAALGALAFRSLSYCTLMLPIVLVLQLKARSMSTSDLPRIA